MIFLNGLLIILKNSCLAYIQTVAQKKKPIPLCQEQTSTEVKVSQAALKMAAPSIVPVDHLTAEVSLLPSLLSTDSHFPINEITFNLSHTMT